MHMQHITHATHCKHFCHCKNKMERAITSFGPATTERHWVSERKKSKWGCLCLTPPHPTFFWCCFQRIHFISIHLFSTISTAINNTKSITESSSGTTLMAMPESRSEPNLQRLTTTQLIKDRLIHRPDRNVWIVCWQVDLVQLLTISQANYSFINTRACQFPTFLALQPLVDFW